MADGRRGWTVALASLAAMLLAAAIVLTMAHGSIESIMGRGVSYGSTSDPAFVEYVRLQVFYYVTSLLGPTVAMAAGLAIVALLVVLALRWDARAGRPGERATPS